MPISHPNELPGYTLDGDAAAECYSDTAGTTVAGEGDAVALWPDQSGGAGAAEGSVSQATANARPLLQVDALGHRYLLYDNTDDHLSNATFDLGSQPFSLTLVFQLLSNATVQALLGDGATVGGHLLARTGDYQANWGDNHRRGAPGTALVVLTVVVNGASTTTWVNGVQQGTAISAGTNAWAAGLYDGTNGPNTLQWLNGGVYRRIAHDAALTPTEVGDLHDLLVDYYTSILPGDPETLPVGYRSSTTQTYSPAVVVSPSVVQAGYGVSTTEGHSPALVGGAGAVAAGYAPSSTEGYSPVPIVGGVTVGLSYAASSTEGYSPTAVPGARTLALSYAPSTTAGYSPAAVPTPIQIAVGYRSSTTQGYSPTVDEWEPARAALLRLTAVPRIAARLSAA